MKELEKKLKELQNQQYEYLTITQILQWIAEIRRDNRAKRISNKCHHYKRTL